MTNSKKIISLLLSVIMIMSVFNIVPLGVSAAEAEITETGAESGKTGDCTWTLDDNGVLTISANGKMGDYDSTYKNGSWVTTAPWGGYSFNTVVIESGVTSIGHYAFYSCTGLTSVTIPDSVASIGKYAFYGCAGLTGIDIPDSVTSIGNGAFWNCTGLTSIKIAEGNTVYDSRNDCNAIINTESNELIYGCKNTVIPDSVTSIGDSAFYKCTGLTSVTIPDSVTSIGGYAFEYCASLTSVTIGSSVTSIGWYAFEYTAWYNDQPDGLVYAGKVAYKMKGSCPSEVVIKDGTLGISDSAFYDCTGLTNVTIPDSVTSIGEVAFYGCTSLTSITIPDSVTSIGYRAFGYYNVSSNQVVKVNDFTIYGKVGSKAERYAKNNGFTFTALDEPEVNSGTTGDCTWKIEGTKLTISGNGKMGDYDSTYKNGTWVTTAPWGGYSFNSVVIESGVTNIGNYAFYGCAGLTSVAIPDSVASIGKYAFYGCAGLNGIDIPDSVTSIGNGAFWNCTGLTGVDIPAALTNIEYSVFSGCTGLTSVTIPNSVTSIGDEAFKGCTSLTSATIGNSVTSIGKEAFSGCAGLTSIDIPNSVTSIGDWTFSNCKGLTDVVIPDSVTSIGKYAFSSCSALTSVDIPDSVTSIGESAFYVDKELTSVDIPDSVTSIGSYAFYGCTKLTGVAIPDSVTSIGTHAFGYYYDEDSDEVYKLDGFTIYGKEGSEAERYANDNGFSFKSGATVKGTITSYVDDSDVTVKLAGTDNNFIAEVKGKDSYEIAAVPAGKYTMTVSKANHVTAEYTITVAGADITQDIEIFPLGDVTGDGKTNVQDCTAILRYVRRIDELSDDQLKRGDVTGDNKVNVQDVTRILRHVRQIEALY